ncbi:hypothetical protein A7982_13636 [Minicystis rosea]|nr:hypothetical protein A7982_13636 [Minicystis rosea]
MLIALVPRWKRLFVLLVFATAAWVVWRRLHPSVPSILAHGGKDMHVLLAGAEPYYLQRDPRWAGDTLAPTQQTMAAVGCLVCSLAMGSEALGAPVAPGALNQRLGASGGYTREARVIWEKLSAATGDAIGVVVHARPQHAILDEALERGELPVVKFTLPSGAPHWVLVVGKEGDEYLVKDPLVTDRTIVKLSRRATSIESVRVLRRR